MDVLVASCELQNAYVDFILKYAPRVITQVDRDPHSMTYGSCDRNHWHLKVRDFDSAILSQTGLALTLLYQLNFQGNIYYQNENMRRWAEATVTYWAKIQHSDGSFDEYFPNEHGFPPTAFSLYSTTQTYIRLGMSNKDVKDKIAKTAHYLCDNSQNLAMNQEIASIAALYSAYLVIKEDWVLHGCKKKLDIALKYQSDEGWFPEHHGADIGYLSVLLDFLSEYYYLSKDECVVEPIKKIVEFMKFFIHPDGSMGGSHGSRETTYFLPSGLEVAAQLGVDIALSIKNKLYADTDKYNYFMGSVDERYLSHYVFHSFLRALEKEQASTYSMVAPKLPCESENTKYFKDAGLLAFNSKLYSSIVGLRKGGVIKVFSDGKETFLDCGYRVNYGNGVVAATNWCDLAYDVSYSENIANVSGFMNKIALRTPTPIALFGLRIVSFLIGNKVVGFLKRNLILVDKHLDVSFERTITFSDDSIEIQDHILSPTPVTIERASNMPLRLVPSAKFFTTSDLLVNPEVIKADTKEVTVVTKIDLINNVKSIELI